VSALGLNDRDLHSRAEAHGTGLACTRRQRIGCDLVGGFRYVVGLHDGCAKALLEAVYERGSKRRRARTDEAHALMRGAVTLGALEQNLVKGGHGGEPGCAIPKIGILLPRPRTLLLMTSF
jgi:hypothetical protein